MSHKYLLANFQLESFWFQFDFKIEVVLVFYLMLTPQFTMLSPNYELYLFPQTSYTINPLAIIKGRVNAMTLPHDDEKQVFWSDENWTSKYHNLFYQN